MEKIRVLHAITRLIIGGAQENTLYTVEGLKKLGYEVDLLTGPPLGREGSLMEEARRKGIEPFLLPYLRRNLHPLYDLLSFFYLYSFLRRKKYHIIHTHSSKAGILGRWAAYLTGVPVIIHTIHGLPFFPYQHPLLNFLFVNAERITATFTDCLIAVCEMMKRKALEAGIGKAHQYVTIYSGMELEKFLSSPSPAPLRKKLGIKDEELVVGKVGRLFPLKGHKFLIQASSRIIREYPQVKFLLVGEGILREKLVRMCEELGVREKFIFAGLIPPSQIPLYISCMDVVVHTSLREGLARVLPQAMAMGKPVVCFRLDGAEEVVKEGENGFLVSPGNVEELAEKTLRLLKDSSLRKKMGQKGRKVVDPTFRVEKMVEDIHRIYQKLLKEKGVLAS